MHIDQAGLHHTAHRVLAQHGINRRKRIVKRTFHEHLTQHLRHQHLAPAGRVEHPRAHTRCGLGKVQRANDPRLTVDECHHVFLIEGVIAKGQHIGARVQQYLGMCARKPHAAGRIFAIHHDKIQPPFITQTRQVGGDRRASCAAHDIA